MASAIALTDPAARRSALTDLVSEVSPKVRALARHDAARDQIANIYQAALKHWLAHIGIRALHKLHARAALSNSGGIALENTKPARGVITFDMAAMSRLFEDELDSAAREAFTLSGMGMMQELETAEPFAAPHGLIQQFVIARQNKLKNVPQEIYDELRGELEAGSAAGETEPQLAARVQSVLGDIESGRAQTIARTETASAYGAGRMAGLKQARFTHKSWLTAHDDRVRHTHNDAEMQGVIPLDEPFNNGLMFPGDPDVDEPSEVINCRCVLQAGEAPET